MTDLEPDADEAKRRREFRLPRGHVPELTAPRRDYVLRFFRTLGYDASGLDDDKLTTVFSLLARVEEYATHKRHNGHNWELDYASPERLGQAEVPVIETWAREWAEQGELKPLPDAPPRWPDGKRFALCLTHDVDTVSGDVFWQRWRSLPVFRGAPFRKKVIVGLSTARALARKCIPGLRPPDPLLAEWVEEEARHGFTSSFFFLAQPLPEPDWEDSFYRYSDRVTYDGTRTTVREVMKDLVRRGWDVGLHGSSRSHASAALLARERSIVSDACGADVVTIRQHHLFYDARYTPLYQAEAGFEADSSVGSNIRTCFRSGTGLPFFEYDIIADRALGILEIPLIIQDVALFSVLQMDADLALEHCVDVMRVVAEAGGAMTLLWHNDHLATDAAFAVYQTLLEEADRMGAWGCSARELSRWWRGRAGRQSE